MNPLNLDLTNPDVVQINGNVINTTSTDNISLNASDSTYIYINVNGNVLSREDNEQLSGLGVKVEKFVSKHTYLAKYGNSDLDVLRQLPFVRTANVFGPSLKIVSTLKQLLLDNPTRLDQKIVVQLHPHPPQNLNQVSQEISNRLNLGLLNIVTSGSAIELAVSQAQLNIIASIDSVGRIEEFVPSGPANDYARGVLGENWDNSSVGNGRNYYRWKGRGEVVCVADSGVDSTHPTFMDRIHAQISLHEPYKSQYMMQTTDPNGHGTHVAGSVCEGVAQECKIINQGLLSGDDAKSFYTVDNMYLNAWAAGAYIHSNSWGPVWPNYQLGYNDNAKAMDNAVYWYPNQDKVIVVSAGNDGGKRDWLGEIGGNNAAKNAICVGNGISLRPNDGGSYNENYQYPDPRGIAKSSSTGWTVPAGGLNGRIKPDVIVPGTAILSCKSSNMTQQRQAEWEPYGYSWQSRYVYSSGTSMATPHVAGCCAVIREALKSPLGGNYTNGEPGGMLIKAILINGCVDLKGHDGGAGSTQILQAPSQWQGFGRVDLRNSLLHIERVAANAPGTGYLDTGYKKPFAGHPNLYQGTSYKGEHPIICDAKVLSVTLAYYDEPDEMTQHKLTLTVYNGEIGNRQKWYLGNQWEPMVGQADQVNNVEKVVWTKQSDDSNQFWIEVTGVRMSQPDYSCSFAVAWMSHD